MVAGAGRLEVQIQPKENTMTMNKNTYTGGYSQNNIPYVMFRFNGEVITLTKNQFENAVRDSIHCNCKDCLVCTALDYYNNNLNPYYKRIIKH